MNRNGYFHLALIPLLSAAIACKAIPGFSTPTPQPSSTSQPTPKPSATWTPTIPSTKTPTATATEGPIGEFQFGDVVALDFLRADWKQNATVLMNQHLTDCTVIVSDGGDFPAILPKTQIAGFTWLTSNGAYLLTIGDQIFGEVNVEYGEKPTDCRKAAETLLKSLHTIHTYAEAGKCASAPKQRLAVGDMATLRTSTYLRTEPRWDEKTRVRLVSPAEKLTIQIIGGPVCAIYNQGEYSYWLVDLSNGKKGWIAEGDLKEYYLTSKY